jgi:anti-anti-sigma factor
VGSRITLRGDYDIWRRAELRAQLEAADLTDDVYIDMSGVTLMDAGSVALLIALKHRLQQQNPNGRVILAKTKRIVRRVLDLCSADSLFVFTPDR